MKRHYHSSKGKYLVGSWLIVLRFSPLVSQWEEWENAGKHGAEQGLRVRHLNPQGAGRKNEPRAWVELLKAQTHPW